MTAITLYQIASELAQTAAKLAELDLDEQTIADTLEGELAPFEAKANAVACVAANLDAEASAYAEHAKKSGERAKALSGRADHLRGYLLANMQTAGVSEIKYPGMVLKLQNNPPSVEVLDERQIPTEFMRTPAPPPAAPDKKAIAEALKAGADVPGAKLKQTQRLVIK